MDTQEFLLKFAKAQSKAGKHGDPIQVNICTINLEDYYDVIDVKNDGCLVVIEVDTSKSLTEAK